MRRKIKHVVILLIFIILLVFVANQYVYAERETNLKNLIKVVKYSDEYKKWNELSSKEKFSVIQPKIYDELNTIFESKNPIYEANLVGASADSKFSLKDVISNNLAIKNQYNTESCWAFSGLSSLETNLALSNYKKNMNKDKIYDFSERHANYSSSRFFTNNDENIFGLNRGPETGGQWYFIENYLTNGQGAVAETDMPFENNSNILDISQIQNKKTISQVYDTVYFDNYNNKQGEERTKIMNEIKQHIQNYGSVFATIHGDAENEHSEPCYDNSTGTKYCNNPQGHPINHAVSLIGWDDDFDKSKFPESSRPNSNGAWIARNSWGENIEYDLNAFKTELFNTYPDKCKEMGWNTPRRNFR